MAIKTEPNEQGGVTYLVPFGTSLSRLPADVRDLVDEADRTVFLDPDGYLVGLAERCTFEPMREWLSALVQGGFSKMLVHTARIGDDQSILLNDVYFDYILGDYKAIYGLKFTKESPRDLIHPSLFPVFDLISLVDPAVWGLAGGQLSYTPGPEGLFTRMGWLEPSEEIDASRCQCLHVSLDGNEIGCDPNGTAIWCKHGHLEAIGPIEQFLDLYFRRLLNVDSVDDSHELVEILRPRDQNEA